MTPTTPLIGSSRVLVVKPGETIMIREFTLVELGILIGNRYY